MVNGMRDGARVQPRGEPDLPPVRVDGQVEPGLGRHVPGPRPGAQHDGVGAHPAVVRPDRDDLVAPRLDVGDRDVGADRRAVPLRPGRVALDHGLRVGEPVARGVGGPGVPVGVDVRVEPAHGVVAEHAALDAALVLHGNGLLEQRDVVGARQEEQVARLLQPDVRARAVREVLVQLQAAVAEVDVRGVGELRAHSPDGLARAAGGELVGLQEQHVHAVLGEVERHRRAQRAATDHHHVSARGQPSPTVRGAPC